jgi:hypothetical protein
VEIQVINQGLPVANAQVSGEWDTDDLGFCVTDATGWCTVELSKLDLSIGDVTFTVIDITADDLIFLEGGITTISQYQ